MENKIIAFERVNTCFSSSYVVYWISFFSFFLSFFLNQFERNTKRDDLKGLCELLIIFNLENEKTFFFFFAKFIVR